MCHTDHLQYRRAVEKRHFAGLISRRSQVQILPAQPAYFAACVAMVASLIHFQVNPARTL